MYDGLWFSPLKRSIDAFVAESQKHVTGDIRMTLHAGCATVTGRQSAESLYDFHLATYDTGDTFDQNLARGVCATVGDAQPYCRTARPAVRGDHR